MRCSCTPTCPRTPRHSTQATAAPKAKKAAAPKAKKAAAAAEAEDSYGDLGLSPEAEAELEKLDAKFLAAVQKVRSR